MTTCSGTWSKGTHDPWARHGLCGGGGNHGTRSAATPIRRDDLRSSCPRTPSMQPIMPLGVVRSGNSASTLCRGVVLSDRVFLDANVLVFAVWRPDSSLLPLWDLVKTELRRCLCPQLPHKW